MTQADKELRSEISSKPTKKIQPVPISSELKKAFKAKIKPILEKHSTSSKLFLNSIKILTKVILCCWHGEPASSHEIRFIIDYTKNKLILFLIPVIFQSLRKMGRFTLNQNGYDSLCEIIMICLSESYKYYITEVPRELLKIANSYHMVVSYSEIGEEKSVLDEESEKEEDDSVKIEKGKSEKIYLLEKIRGHNIWQDFKFWECCLLENISSSKKNYDFHDKDKSIEIYIVQDGYKEIVMSNILSLAMQIYDVTGKGEMAERLVEKYFQAYRLPDESYMKIYSALKSYRE